MLFFCLPNNYLYNCNVHNYIAAIKEVLPLNPQTGGGNMVLRLQGTITNFTGFYLPNSEQTSNLFLLPTHTAQVIFFQMHHESSSHCSQVKDQCNLNKVSEQQLSSSVAVELLNNEYFWDEKHHSKSLLLLAYLDYIK